MRPTDAGAVDAAVGDRTADGLGREVPPGGDAAATPADAGVDPPTADGPATGQPIDAADAGTGPSPGQGIDAGDGGTAPDASPLADPCCVLPDLCGPAAVNAPERGGVAVAASHDFVALCQGWVVLGDRAANQLVIRNLFSGAERMRVGLPSAPERVLVDPARRLAFASHDPAVTLLSKVDLGTGKATTMTLAAGVKDVALTGTGQLLALSGNEEYVATSLLVIDEGTQSISTITAGQPNTPSAMLGGFGSRLGYRPQGSLLFFETADLSPSGLVRATLSLTALTVTPLDSLGDNGTNCPEVVVSNDGRHLAVPCGSGNSTTAGLHTVIDRSPDDLTTVLGEWATGPYPAGAAFSQDGRYFVASDTHAIHLFSVSAHTEMSSVETTRCDLGSITRVRVSPDSLHAYALSRCGLQGDSAQVSWVRLR